jgi:hypothetical protein
MAGLGFLLLLVSAISVIYPLRFLMIPNRGVAVLGVIASLVIIGAAVPTKPAANNGPLYTSSGGCTTDANGEMKCSHSADTNFLGSTTRSTFDMKCGKSISKLDAYECKSESSVH